MKKVLLHICCAVCASHCIERLQEEGLYVEGFFYNPNIYPEDEYLRRLKEARRVCDIKSIKLADEPNNPQLWFDKCAKYSSLPEGGERCLICYELRLRATYELCLSLDFDFFTTTLSVSPHKSSKIIKNVGDSLNADKFIAIDFKKKNGFSKALAFAKEHNLYRQNYCGCMYSLKKT